MKATASATQIRFIGATIPAGGSCMVTTNVLSNRVDTYTNTIAARGVTTYEGITDEDATGARLVVTSPLR